MIRIKHLERPVEAADAPQPEPTVAFPDLVDSWVSEGIISREQATVIKAHAPESGPVPAPAEDRTPLAMEALGYLGGVIIVVSAFLIAAQYWRDLTTGPRLVVVGTAVVALLACGAAVPERLGATGIRLRSVLWLAAAGAGAGFMGLFGYEVLDLSDADLAVLIGAGTAALAAVLWWANRVIPQQAAVMAALMVTAAAVIADTVTADSLPGLGIWMVAATWLLLGWAGLLGPRRPVLALSSAAMIFGGIFSAGTDSGAAFAVATAIGVISLAVLLRDLVVLAVGAVGMLAVLPQAITLWFPDSSAVPYVLLAVGLLLVGVAVWTARRRRVRQELRAQVLVTLTPSTAISVAAVVWVAVLATVMVIGLT